MRQTETQTCFHSMKMTLILLILLLASALVICISLLVAIQLWFYKSTKRYEGIPAYGTKNPLLLTWQHYQQIFRTGKDDPPASYLFKVASAFATMFQREGVFFMWIGFEPHVGIYKAEYIKKVINSKLADDKSKHYHIFLPVVGSGLATSSGNKHTRRRKLLQPAFHSRILESYVDVFNGHSLILVNKLKRVTNEPSIDISPIIAATALDILCHTIMGIDICSQQGKHEAEKYMEAIDGMADILIHRVARPWLLSDTIFYFTSVGQQFRKAVKIASDFTRKVTNQRLESLKLEKETNEYNENSKRSSKSFLDLLLEHHVQDRSLTLEDVQEEVNTFMFAGHDTSTIAVSWVLYLLGLHPDVQDKVYQEQLSIFGDNKTAEATNEDVKAMSYLESVIKETLRLYPPGSFTGRENKE
ncbi:Cytochrome P450 4C1, partial [Stegodyphus mimosarum]